MNFKILIQTQFEGSFDSVAAVVAGLVGVSEVRIEEGRNCIIAQAQGSDETVEALVGEIKKISVDGFLAVFSASAQPDVERTAAIEFVVS